MSLNEAELHDVCRLIDARAAGARVRDIREVADHADEWTIELRIPGENLFLILSLDPEFTRVSLRDAKPTAPKAPAAFTMLLRARLSGSILREVKHLPGDRVTHLHFDALNEHGEVLRYALIAELTGRHGNLYLLNEANEVEGVADPRKAGIRGSSVKSVYQPPDSPPQRNTERRDDWESRAAGPDFFQWIEESIDEARERRTKDETLRDARTVLKREAKRLRRKIRNIESDLHKAEDSAQLKRRADLLQGAYQTYKRGMTAVEVRDYHDPEQPLVQVETEPNVALSRQIETLYHEYKRLHAAIPDIEQRLLEAMEDLEKVEHVRESIDESSPNEVIEQRISTLRSQRTIRTVPTQQRRRGDKDSAQRKAFRLFYSSDGWPIYVGRSAKDNDVLTLQIANGRDLWMHARDWSGSHVVIRREKKKEDIPSRTLNEAALLAAHFSGGQSDTTVEVGYTERKHVSKPNGAPAGSVYVAGMKTLMVTPDPSITDRLSRTRDDE